MMAGEALAERALAALEAVAGLNGRYAGEPLRAAMPYAIVEAGAESDWSHKSGAGREVRLTVSIRDGGETPARLRRLAADSDGVVTALGGASGGWRIVSLQFARSRIVPEGDRQWLASLDYRARMLAE